MPIYTYLQILFFVSELALLILKRSKSGTVKNKRDRRSLLILWIVIGGCMCIGPALEHYHLWALHNTCAVMLTGMIIYTIGFIIRWSAIIQLGKMFTVDVIISDNHILKTNGLYKIVRHPSYLGLILIIAGLVITLNSAFSLLIVLFFTLLSINYRISVEEKALIEEFGDRYEQYKTRVNKIIPWIY